MKLPNHIADMCGIVMAEPPHQVPAEEFKAVQKNLDEDGIFRILYRGQVVGWISEHPGDKGPKYRALTINNRISRFYTANEAMTWLLEESF
jgi:hypothetical protein